MSEETFAERFLASEGRPINCRGQTVQIAFELDVVRNEEFELIFETSRETPIQGIHVSIDSGTLEVGLQRVKHAVLWRDTAPKRVVIRAHPKQASGRLRLWNGWKNEQGESSSGLGNAGLVADRSGGEIVLRCSDGVGPPEFDDLVVRIRTRGVGGPVSGLGSTRRH